jgi:predicted transposase YdaD
LPNEYDAVLKRVLSRSPVFRANVLHCAPIKNSLNIELSEFQNLRADLVWQTLDDEILHIEIQSTNDKHLARRMAQYWLYIRGRSDKDARQIVLYFGEEPLRRPPQLTGRRCRFEYDVVDICRLDGGPQLEAAEVGDNIIGLLSRLKDPRGAVPCSRIVHLGGSAARVC